MKRALVFFVFAIANVIAFSQLVTISGLNQIPQVDDTIYYTNVNDFGFELAGVGPVTEKIWDYSTLTENDDLFFYYVDPSTTVDAAEFPDATIAEAVDGTEGFIYIETGDYFMARKGLSGEMFINYYTDSALLFNFPITAGHSFSSTYTGMLFASGLEMIIDDGDVEIEADAQGTLITPNGSVFNDVLRLHVTEKFSGKYDLGTGTLTEILSVEDDYYYWYHEDYTGAILIYGITIVESISGNEETEVLRYQPIELTSKMEKPIKAEVNVYPNPSNGLLNFRDLTNIETIEVLNAQGQIVKSYNACSQIDLGYLANGVYFVKTVGTNTNISKIVLNK